jgi:molecular chaperone GrpE
MTEKKSSRAGENQSEGANTTVSPEVDPQALVEQLQKVGEERDGYKDQLLRTMADFQNFRKRVRDEQRQIEERANERLIVELLPVLDNFERALVGMESGATLEAVVEGIKAIDRQFRAVLDGQKLKRVDSVGKQFDPEHHDALALVETTEHEEGTVIEEVESGYRIGERVIRPARVRVSKKP